MPTAEAQYLNALPLAVIAVDRDLHINYLNQSAEMLLEISASNAVGRELASLPAFDEEFAALCQRVLTSGEAISQFERTLTMPGMHTTVTLRITPVVTTTPEDDELLIVISKTEGRDKLAANQWKRETARAAGVMAAMLAHEVKNPLSGIRGAAQLLKEEVTEEQQSLTDLICRETDRINELLSQVEIFDNSAPDAMQPVNIHEVLQYVISVARTFGTHITFKEKYDPSLPMVRGRRDLLVQLFLNLVKNAAEALEGQPDATITLTTNYRSGYKVEQALPIAVTVEDNGPGIPEAVRAHLFEPFISSKEKGRGLGLAIVAKLASDLGAVAELDAEYTNGTRFAVWLPVER